MKKIALLSLLSTSILLGAENLVTIIESNSLLKIGKNNIVSAIDDNDKLNISKGLNDKLFKNISPYKYNKYEKIHDDSPTVITMIGEKSIQYGSIYSKGFGEKYNINNLATFVMKKNFSLALMTLDLFNNNDLIYARTKLNHITKNDLIPLVKYIEENIEKEKQERYFNRLDFIYDILDYTNKIYDYQSSINIPVIKPVLFDIKSVLNNNSTLGNTGFKEYEYSGDTLKRYCLDYDISRSFDDDGGRSYDINYSRSLVSSINISQPIPLTSLYVFQNYKCPTITNYGRWWRLPKVTYGSSMPSASKQKQNILMQIKNQRNGGSYLNTMKSFYSHLNNNSTIKNSLRKLNDRGINYGKVLYVNYGLAEGVTNDTVHLGVIKNITTGSIYNDKINMIMNEGFMYDADNAPSYFYDKTNTMSELSKKDTNGNSFSTLYYVVNQKISPKVPEIDNFHMYSNLIPSASKHDPISELYGSEIMWLTNKSGEYINPYVYNNPEEYLIDPNNELDEEELINGMKKYLRNTVDIKPNAEQYYPINLKGISFSYVPSNNENETAIRYFGPRFNMKTFIDKYTKKTIVKEPIDCSKENCTNEQKAMANPTKDVEKIEESIHCGATFTNPDTPNYKYIVFEDIINKIVEEPFGDIQFHAHKEYKETKTEIFNSEAKVPNIYKYMGKVNNIEECELKANIEVESALKNKLSTEGLLNFDFNQELDELDEVALEEFGDKSDRVTGYIDEILSNNTILIRENTETSAFLEDSVDYESSTKDTFFNYFKELKNRPNVSIGKSNDIETIIDVN